MEKSLPNLAAIARTAKDNNIRSALHLMAGSYHSTRHKAIWKAYYEQDTTTILNRTALIGDGPLDADWFRVMQTFVEGGVAPTPASVGATVAKGKVPAKQAAKAKPTAGKPLPKAPPPAPPAKSGWFSGLLPTRKRP